LRKDSSWAKDYYTPGTPQYKSRINVTTGWPEQILWYPQLVSL
jgi:hypothetical protein